MSLSSGQLAFYKCASEGNTQIQPTPCYSVSSLLSASSVSSASATTGLLQDLGLVSTHSKYASDRQAERPANPESQNARKMEISYKEITGNCSLTLGDLKMAACNRLFL